MPSRRQQNSREIYGVALIALAILVTLSIFDVAGILGVYLVYGLKWTVGAGRYFAPLFLLILGILLFGKDPEESLEKTTIGFVVLLFSLSVAIHLRVSTPHIFDRENIWQYGGVIGAGFSYGLRYLLGIAGSYVLVVAGVLTSLLFVTGVSLRELGVKIKEMVGNKPAGAAAQKRQADVKSKARPVVGDNLDADETVEVARPRPRRERSANPGRSRLKAVDEDQMEIIDEPEADGYLLPPVSLLKRSGNERSLSKKDEREQVSILEQTLRDFDVICKVDKVVKGPTVTRFELQLASGIKVSRVVSLADDIALALASADIRVLAPIPGKSAVGIEVPNSSRQLVALGDILKDINPREGGPINVAIGMDITGKPVLKNIAEMPHLLIAGATGSGKSVCVNNILMSILLRANPNQVKLVLIDPKRVELNLYNDIPHLLVPVVTGPKEAANVLSWAVGEMEARYQLLSDARVRNISGYNKAVKAEPGEREPLPFIVIIIDELADLMMVAAGEVEDAICRLAQMARAVGIHLVVATQRPAANIITGQIKANIICRIAFQVSSQVDSRVVLDANGAEKLVGKGDMLFMTPDSPKPSRLQAPFITEGEVELVVEAAKRQGKPEYKREILAVKKTTVEVEWTDDLFDEALDLVVTTGQASTSSLQRRLRVGYARAARLMDMLEQRGLISPADGSKPRDVLISREELDELRATENSA